ncbi:hypothetical protein C8R44DRAFT_870220 [Mycena epipterygia]|nr:hypothetical protein C8R44DRAFT_870220 [Mycena epipterygia]
MSFSLLRMVRPCRFTTILTRHRILLSTSSRSSKPAKKPPPRSALEHTHDVDSLSPSPPSDPDSQYLRSSAKENTGAALSPTARQWLEAQDPSYEVARMYAQDVHDYEKALRIAEIVAIVRTKQLFSMELQRNEGEMDEDESDRRLLIKDELGRLKKLIGDMQEIVFKDFE